MEIPRFSKVDDWLKVYDKADYIVIQKARFLFFLNLAIFLTVLLMMAARIIAFLFMNDPGPNFLVELAPFSILLIVLFLYQLLLVKGFYTVVVHLILLTILAVTWYIGFTKTSDLLGRFSTPVFLFTVLAMVPLLAYERKVFVIIYPMLNILLLGIFLYVFAPQYNLTQLEIIDYFVDMVAAIVFITVIGYKISSINNKALQKSNKELLLRKAAEVKLEDTEQRYKKLSENSPQIIFELDFLGNITYLNETGLKEFGYAKEEISKFRIRDIVEEKEVLKLNLERVLRLELFEHQYTGIRKNGDTFYVLTYSTPIEKEGEFVGVRGVAINVTEKIEAQNALLASELKYRELANLVPITIYEAGIDKIISYANQASLDMFGYSENEIVGKLSMVEILATEERERAFEDIDVLTKQGVTSSQKYRALKKDGSKFPVQIISSTIYENEKVVGYRGAVVDMSDIENANKKLKDNEALLRTIVDMLPYPINITDFNQKIVFLNQAFLERNKVTYEQALGKTVDELGLHLDESSKVRVLNTLMAGESVKDLQASIIKPEGAKVDVLMSTQPILYNGNPHFLTTTVDITEKVALENQLKEHNEKLEYVVVERTEELAATNEELHVANDDLLSQREELEKSLLKLKLAQEQLIQTEKMASLGILTAGVAHEINNPMNYIFNGALVIKHHVQDKYPEDYSELKTYFDAIDEGVARATSIVSSLSDYSRKESTEKVMLNVHQIIDNCLTIIFSEYKNRVEIERKYGADVPLFLGYETKLHQAFLNILVNAVQAIEDTGTIVITTILIDENIEILIQDSGKGIDSRDLKHIFDPFFTTKLSGKGTGLGLSITNQKINEHGGNISCTSAIGEGSVFKIVLPYKTE